MKKVTLMLALAGLGAATVMTACSSGAEPKKPTKAEECASGISTECLIGEWSANGLASRESGEMVAGFNYISAPGKLSFREDGTFAFIAPAGAPAAVIDCPKVYGTWSLAGATLTMKGTVGNECLNSNTFSGTPKISLEGASVKMSMEPLYFLYNATDEATVRTLNAELYTISAQ